VVVPAGAVRQTVLVEDIASEGEGTQDPRSPASELEALGGILLEEVTDEAVEVGLRTAYGRFQISGYFGNLIERHFQQGGALASFSRNS
jgi:hypothetical protein